MAPETEDISYNDIIEALQEAFKQDPPTPEREPGVFRTEELAEAIGRSESTIRRILKRWLAEGRIEVIEGVHIIDFSGRPQTVRGYRLIEIEERDER